MALREVKSNYPTGTLNPNDGDGNDNTAMDITNYVVSRREAALLVGDHNTYHSQTSRRLAIVRKKLDRATQKNAKYAPKSAVTAEDIAKNHEYVAIYLGCRPLAYKL